jgi:PAS domain S-box-containing protein
VKGVKSKESKVIENELYRDVKEDELFWKIFNNNQCALAITDEQGELRLCNSLFNATALQVERPLDFRALLEKMNSHTPTVVTTAFKWNTGKQILQLTPTLLNEPSEGKRYLWMACCNYKDSVHGTVSTLKNLYRSFIDTSFELIFRTSTEGKVLFTNSLFLRGFGFSNYRDIKGHSIESIFENKDDYNDLKEYLLRHKRVEAKKVYFLKADGTRLTGLVNCHLYHYKSGTSVLNWTLLDISVQVESENILKSKNDQLAKVNHQMEKFLYSTSHDLRSPITSILGLINLIRMESKDLTIADYISKIESSTLKLDKIIRDIMSFSMATYQRMGSEKIDFEALVWKSFNQHRNDPATRKITFEVKVKEGLPFYSDPQRLEIIFDNIVRNAIHFYDSNKAKCFIQVNVTNDNTHTQLEFIDNGIGIGKQHLDNIFTIFYKASHLSKGAGLGLFIVKETIEKLNGNITVESEIGFGTVLRITIPNDHKGKLIGRKLQLVNQA